MTPFCILIVHNIYYNFCQPLTTWFITNTLFLCRPAFRKHLLPRFLRTSRSNRCRDIVRASKSVLMLTSIHNTYLGMLSCGFCGVSGCINHGCPHWLRTLLQFGVRDCIISLVTSVATHFKVVLIHSTLYNCCIGTARTPFHACFASLVWHGRATTSNVAQQHSPVDSIVLVTFPDHH
jgi:hypothetical protein